MKYCVKISLNLNLSEKKTADRIEEIKSAAPYFSFQKKPNISFQEIILSEKKDIKKLLGIIENSLSEEFCLRLMAGGWRIQNSKGQDKFFLKVSPHLNCRDFFYDLKEEILKSKIAENLKYAENGYDILIFESQNRGDTYWFLSAIKEKKGILSTLLLKTLYRRCKKPLHTPRKFCFLTDVLSIDISINDKKYRTYSIPKKEWHQPGDKNAHKKTLEEYRILCRYQLCSRNGFSADGKTKKIFVSSDLHLGHCDIIDAAARPFKKDSVKEMDEILISNWNCTVDADDTVIFAGDLTYNKNSDETDEYLKRLNGDIIFISGNHDTAKCKMHTQYELKHGGFSFLFIHNPKNAPEKYDGWIVHGHTHNSRMCEYPFIDFQNRTINISCELTQYRPADIDEIIDIIKCGMNRRINRIYSMDAGAF